MYTVSSQETLGTWLISKTKTKVVYTELGEGEAGIKADFFLTQSTGILTNLFKPKDRPLQRHKICDFFFIFFFLQSNFLNSTQKKMMRSTQILDASSKQRSFFNKRKLKGRTTQNCFWLNYDSTGPSQRKNPNPLHWGKEVSLRIQCDHTLHTMIAESVIIMLFLRTKIRKRLGGDSVTKKEVAQSCCFLKREKMLIIIYKLPILFARKYHLCLGCNSQLRLFKTDSFGILHLNNLDKTNCTAGY